ncbi:MAG TPA: serine/threonine-protein kinase [Nannocystis sp.]|jgi:serine/threonine-protein kinase
MNSVAAPARPRDSQTALVRLGKYELLTRLAVGGMAELFVARTLAQHGFEKLVALKRILASHADDENFIRMLLAEARLAATLHHPNIAQVYDVGDDNGTFFFTMEYVVGQDLRQIVRAIQAKGEWLTPEHILQIVIGTAAGLHYAHDKEDGDGNPLGIVHRDVSPSNILVSYDGSVKLVDFGIARVTALQTNTGLGALKGKVPYMSPEQCRGEALDRRSDVFSLGIILWELSLRRRLFSGDNDLVVAGKVCNEDAPAPTSIDPDYPPELEAIVLKALARDRDQRWASAQELQLALEQYAFDRHLLLSSAKLGSFMSELFADLIRKTKANLREKIASSTGLFPIPPDVIAASASASSRPAATLHVNEATTSGLIPLPDDRDSEQALTRPEGQREATRRPPWLWIAGGGVAAAILLMISLGGDPPEPAPSASAAAPVIAEPPAPVVTPPVVVAPSVPAVQSSPEVPATAPAKSTPTPAAKKKSGKSRTTKKSTNWDPDSPILPP